MKTVPDATRCVESLNGLNLHGRSIRVDYSATRKPHQPTPGQYMGEKKPICESEPRRMACVVLMNDQTRIDMLLEGVISVAAEVTMIGTTIRDDPAAATEVAVTTNVTGTETSG